MSLKEHTRYAFIDVETSGLNPDIHEIIEIGCLIVAESESGYTIENELEIKVAMTRPELAEATALRVNGYDPAAWMFAYTMPQALEMLNKHAKDCVFIAHNACFDWQFVEKAYRDAKMEHPFHYHKLDTLSIAYAKLKGTDAKHLSLRSLCQRFAVTNEKAHTALADCRATFEVFKKLMA
jgi:DNA polymerase-3 subunit alpha (Gram-positive type)